ncbi:MAG: DUF58 domain-containing protein [Planctomycetota bacterium]|jgi:uncharacterized protein (DUF58 family)
MIVPGTGPIPSSLDDLLTPGLRERLDSLDLRSIKRFAGIMPGERHAKRKGRSVEFADYRNYTPGDDLRHIDWKVFARLDRLFLKLYIEEEDISLHIALDESLSMDAGNPSKLTWAQRLAMGLAYVGLHGRNRVSLSRFGRERLQVLPECRGMSSVDRAASFMLATHRDEGGGRVQASQPIDDSLRRIASLPRGGGVLVVISDLLTHEGIEQGIRALGARPTFDCAIVQILSPGELDPSKERATLMGDLRLTDAETGEGREVTANKTLVERYRKRLDAHCNAIERLCHPRGIAYLRASSQTPIEDVVLGFFRRRGLLK